MGRYESGRRRRRAPGAGCMEDEVRGEGRGGGVGPATGLVGLGSGRFGFGTEPGQSAGRGGLGQGAGGEPDSDGGALYRGPAPRGRLGRRDVRGKPGRSRPHLGWGFGVPEVREIGARER